MDRLEALSSGHKTYDSTEPCKNCGNFKRYVKQRSCVFCLASQAKKKPSVRQLAKKAGQVTYRTGKPCKHGHDAPRFTSTGGCTLCVNPKSDLVTVRLRVHISDVSKLEAYATALRLTRPSV